MCIRIWAFVTLVSLVEITLLVNLYHKVNQYIYEKLLLNEMQPSLKGNYHFLFTTWILFLA